MKSTDPMLPAAIMQKVMEHKDFHTVATMVARNTSGKIFLVGGKVYRTAIQLIHGYDCGAEEADWDFLCMGEVAKKHRAFRHPGWFVDYPDYDDYKQNSMCLKMQVEQPHPSGIGFVRYSSKKIDIIGIKDIILATKNPTNSVQDYLNIVPLTVQACALSTGRGVPRLYGKKAIESIEQRMIKVNNQLGALPGLNMPRYIQDKASSLQFSIAGSQMRIPCNCYSGDIKALFNNGCQSPKTHY